MKGRLAMNYVTNLTCVEFDQLPSHWNMYQGSKQAPNKSPFVIGSAEGLLPRRGRKVCK